MTRAVAIVGMGARLPGAPHLLALADTVERGRVPVRAVPAARWDHTQFYDPNPRRLDRTYANVLASVDDIDRFAPEFFGILPRRARFMDPQQRLLLDAARAALEDAGRGPGALPRATGVYVGISVSEYYQLTTARVQLMQAAGGRFGRVPEGLEDLWEVLGENVPPIQAHSMVGQMLNMAAANVAQAFDLGGPAMAIDSACSSALVALGEAILHLREGVCDAALVGGVYTACTPGNMIAFSRIGAISPSNACRPFDDRADGFVLGEGAGCVLLKRLEDAVADGDRIWAVVRGFGVNNDGRAEGPMTPRLGGQVACMEQAYADAGASPAEVGLVEAHGTATRVGDMIEAGSLAKVFGPARRGVGGLAPCRVTSIKGNIGHTLAAAGAAGLMSATLSLARRRIARLAGFERLRGELPLGDAGVEVASESADWTRAAGGERRMAAVSSFGFGGTNVHVVLEEAPEGAAPRRARWAPSGAEGDVQAAGAPAQPELFLVTAPTAALLAQHARDLAAHLRGDEAPLADVAYTLARRAAGRVRAAVVAGERDALCDELERIADAAEAGSGGDTMFAGTANAEDPGRAAERLAFLFPGQGAQAPDLCRDLWDRFPAFRRRLERLAGAVGQEAGAALLAALYPDPAEGEDGHRRAAAELVKTEVCQPALAALALALADLFGELGVVPGVVLGHSLGEFVAAAVGGALDPEETVRLVAKRGRLMAELDGDAGAMAALGTDREGARRLVEGVDGAVLANFNHPRQVVASGTREAIDAVLARAADSEVRATRLPVSHGFHSPVVAPMAERFAEVLGGAAVRAPEKAVVVSCAAAPAPGRFEDEPAAVRERLARHAVSAIDFEAGVEEAWRAGAREFVQVGAGGALLSMATAILAARGEKAALLVPAAPAESRAGEGLLAALARLVGAGVDVRPAALFSGRDVRLTALPPSPLETRSFWVLTPPATLRPLPRVGSGAGAVAVQGGATAAHEHEHASAPPEVMDLFERQLDVLRGQLDVLRGLGVEVRPGAPLLARGAGSVIETQAVDDGRNGHAAQAAPAPAAGNGHAAQAGAGNGHAAQAAPAAPGNGHAAQAAPAAAGQDGRGSSGGLDRAAVEQRVIDIVARVSALPADSIAPNVKLSQDLGLDSLLVVELGAALQESFGLGPLPQSMLSRDASVADLVDGLMAHLGDSPGAAAATTASPAGTAPATTEAVPASAAPPDAAPEPQEPALLRHLASWAPRPLPPPAGAPALITSGGAVVIGDRGGAALALAARLRGAGREVEVVSAGEIDGAGFTWPDAADLLVDASSLDSLTETPIAAALRAKVARTVRVLTAATRAGVRPAILCLAADPLAAAAGAGVTRALAAEWPDRLARTVQIDPHAGPARAAELAHAELCTTDWSPEVRWSGGQRSAIELHPAPIAPAPARLGARTAIITGGGRGLGARLAVALARAGVTDIGLIGRHRPGTEVARTVAAIEEAGGRARYRAADVCDPAALSAAVDQLRGELGPIELAVHAAGVTADGPVEGLTGAELSRVFDTKVAGALSLWCACRRDPLAGFLIYGSWAGRFGNRHQVAYAAANRTAAALVGRLGENRPEVHVATVDLPPWEGSGMAQRMPDAVRRAMRARGVPFVSDAEGLAHLMAELAAPAGAAEVVLGGGPPASGRRDRATALLDPRVPWLDHHQVGGVPRLPLAALLDLAAAAAARVGLAPDAGTALSLTDVRVLAPIPVGPHGARLAVEARADGAAPGRAGTGPGAALEIYLEPDAPGAGLARLVATCRADVVAGPLPPLDAPPAGATPPALDLEQFYREHTFHGPSMHGIARVDLLDAGHIAGAVRSGGPAWSQAGLDILALDGALQLAGYFARVQHQLSALPVGVTECRVLAPLAGGGPIACSATLEAAAQGRLRGHLDLVDDAGRPLVQLRGLDARTVDDTARAGGPRAAARPPRPPRPRPATPASIDPSTYQIDQFPEVAELVQRMKIVSGLGLENPYFNLHERLTNHRSVIGGVEYINFSSYNYLGLSGHPEVNQAATEAVQRYGTSVSASRVASGEKPLHRELEHAIADFLGTEDAVVMVSGHATNVSVIGCLFDSRDVILHDSLAHDSILGGARLSGARRRPFPHNDPEALASLLEQVRPQARRVLIAVEGVYSMDGDLAALERIVELKHRYGALLLVDEAHSLGVVGGTGRGIGEHCATGRTDVDLWMGTLSKSLASCGGYIAGSARLVEYLKYSTPGFVYSVGISPPNAASALAALHVLDREPERVRILQSRSRLFLDALIARGVDTGLSSGSAVVPAIIGNSMDSLRLAQALHRRHINVQPILHPAVEEDLARLRFFVTSGHSEADLIATADAVREELMAIDPSYLRRPTDRPTAVVADPTRAPRWEGRL